MSFNNLVMYNNIFPQLQPVDGAGTAQVSKWVDMKTAHTVAFLANFGVITASADDTVTFTVECGTVGDTAAAEGTPVAFTYRLSSAVTANTWGAPTVAVATAGYAPLTSALTGMALWVEVDPAQAQATVDTGRYLRLVVTPTAGVSANLLCINAISESRYHNYTMISATVAT